MLRNYSLLKTHKITIPRQSQPAHAYVLRLQLWYLLAKVRQSRFVYKISSIKVKAGISQLTLVLHDHKLAGSGSPHEDILYISTPGRSINVCALRWRTL